jgi:hypothetical protein
VGECDRPPKPGRAITGFVTGTRLAPQLRVKLLLVDRKPVEGIGEDVLMARREANVVKCRVNAGAPPRPRRTVGGLRLSPGAGYA